MIIARSLLKTYQDDQNPNPSDPNLGKGTGKGGKGKASGKGGQGRSTPTHKTKEQIKRDRHEELQKGTYNTGRTTFRQPTAFRKTKMCSYFVKGKCMSRRAPPAGGPGNREGGEARHWIRQGTSKCGSCSINTMGLMRSPGIHVGDLWSRFGSLLFISKVVSYRAASLGVHRNPFDTSTLGASWGQDRNFESSHRAFWITYIYRGSYGKKENRYEKSVRLRFGGEICV